jgi:hypothetical protein
MTSQHRILANRANASHSTGPRTADGKARSRGNATRHGLSATVTQASDADAKVERLAAILREEWQSNGELPRIIADAEITILRIRAMRAVLLEAISSDVEIGMEGARQAEDLDAKLDQLRKLDDYERRALSRRHNATRELARLAFDRQQR